MVSLVFTIMPSDHPRLMIIVPPLLYNYTLLVKKPLYLKVINKNGDKVNELSLSAVQRLG